MLSGSHVKPFSRVSGGRLRVEYLVDKDGRVVAFLDRLCRLVRRLEGWPRERVEEALRRQERRVRDSARGCRTPPTIWSDCFTQMLLVRACW